MQTCTKCNIQKPLTEFYEDKKTKNGHGRRCKLCYKKDYLANPEKVKDNFKKWKVKNPEKAKILAEKVKKSYNIKQKERRHQKGISKHYASELGVSHTKEYKKAKRHERRMLFKKGGELTQFTVQMIYEDNIKRFGTLTCYLCLNPVPFGKDHLEHKTPLSRGGTNEYNNLEVSCQHCNCKKHNKTLEEFLKL